MKRSIQVLFALVMLALAIPASRALAADATDWPGKVHCLITATTKKAKKDVVTVNVMVKVPGNAPKDHFALVAPSVTLIEGSQGQVSTVQRIEVQGANALVESGTTVDAIWPVGSKEVLALVIIKVESSIVWADVQKVKIGAENRATPAVVVRDVESKKK